MHPKIVFPGALAPIFRDLATPVHQGSLRDPRRTACPATEVSLSGGFAIDAGDFTHEKHLDVLLDDFRRFLTVAMEVQEVTDGYPIRLRRNTPDSCPSDAAEAHEANITPAGCELRARDLPGLWRAVSFIEDEMSLRRAPVLPLGRPARWTRVRTRISRSPVAPYRWLSGWELEDENDYYPEAYLARLAHSGVNGIWAAGLLRNLVASRTIPELGPEHHRLDKLQRLVEKTARYGIKVYLFCIEPRALPPGHPARSAHPEIVGAHGALCPSTPLVLDYVREVMRELLTAVPDLGGVINIFNSERYTTCWANADFVQDCPRCRVRPQAEVLGENLDAFMAGIRDASPSAEFLAWTYMMDPKTRSLTTLPIGPMLDIMAKSRSDIIWLGNFEHGGVKEVRGKSIEVHEYALSYVGPSTNFTDLAQAGRDSDRKVYAKLQIGTSYELPTVPHVPVPGIAYDKMSVLDGLGVTGTMLGWVPGGFPGPMLKAAGEAAFEPRLPKPAFLRRLAGIVWGEVQADRVAAAWDCLAQAWQGYPFNNRLFYFGPMVRGPAYPFHLEREARLALPYNWGLDRSRQPQPFEDQVERWLGPFSAEEMVCDLRRMAAEWDTGLQALRSVRRDRAPDGRADLDRQVAVATAVRLQCLAAAGVFEFYAARDRLASADDTERHLLLQRMRAAAEESLHLAEEMKPLLTLEPAIGFHTEMYAYSYSAAMLDEKILQVRDMLQTLAQWEQNGIDAAVLLRTVEEVERQRPDRAPDRWGD